MSRPGNFNLANAYAAQALVVTCPSVTTTATSTLFRYQRANPPPIVHRKSLPTSSASRRIKKIEQLCESSHSP